MKFCIGIQCEIISKPEDVLYFGIDVNGCFDSFRKGSKMLIKFSVEKFNEKELNPNRYSYYEISVPPLSNTYFEYSLSGSSKALSF